MANNFITNSSGEQTLRKRLNTLISISDELKFLVGFFYFSGWQELYTSLQANERIQLKLLVGLQVDKLLSTMAVFEHGAQEDGLSQEDHFNQFMSSLGYALDDYLDRLLKRVEYQKNEVIVAVENIKIEVIG